MATPRFKRKKIWVQAPIQGTLAIKCALYWFFCLGSIFLFVAVATLFSGKLQSAGEIFSGLWKQYSSAVLASVFLLPLIVWDVIRFSHRVVGPLLRLEREMGRLARGEDVRPIHFREKDFWHPLADKFNRIVANHNALKAAAIETTANTTAAKPSQAELERLGV